MGTGREWGGLGTSRIRYGGLLLVLPYKKLLVLPHKKQLVLPYKKQIWGPLVLLPYEKELVLPYKERASQVKVWDPICHHICPIIPKMGKFGVPKIFNFIFSLYKTSLWGTNVAEKNALYKLKLQKKEAYFWKHANNILQLEILLGQGYCSCGFGPSGLPDVPYLEPGQGRVQNRLIGRHARWANRYRWIVTCFDSSILRTTTTFRSILIFNWSALIKRGDFQLAGFNQ